MERKERNWLLFLFVLLNDDEKLFTSMGRSCYIVSGHWSNILCCVKLGWWWPVWPMLFTETSWMFPHRGCWLQANKQNNATWAWKLKVFAHGRTNEFGLVEKWRWRKNDISKGRHSIGNRPLTSRYAEIAYFSPVWSNPVKDGLLERCWIARRLENGSLE